MIGARVLLGSVLMLGAWPTVVLAANTEPSILVSVGVNRSFDERLQPLRYARSDAEKVAAAAVAVGLADSATTYVGKSGFLADFRSLMAVVQREAQGRPKAEPWRFVFDFSGHADDRGLHFEDGVLPNDELHRLLDQLTAKTKIIVIDTCFAGAIATKGVEAAPAFALPKLDLDELSGTVYLAASSSRNVAFESDELGGSVFTHYLVRGLGGHADANKDQLVTIDELYQYVYREMRLRAMTLPMASAQRPEIHADLHGAGALIVARPRAKAGMTPVLSVDPGIMGAIDVASMTGLGTFRVRSNGETALMMPLPEGPYRAVIRRGRLIGEASFNLTSTVQTKLLASDFTWHESQSESTALKGVSLGGSGLTAMLALRGIADAKRGIGPFAEVRSELVRLEQGRQRFRILSMTSAYQADGGDEETHETAFGMRTGIGLTFSSSWSDQARLLTAIGEGFEWQAWRDGGGNKESSAGLYPTMTVGALINLDGPTQGSRELALRYDVDYVKTRDTNSLGRRDTYILGMTFKP